MSRQALQSTIFDAIYDQINEFNDQNGRQVNSHTFKKKNRVRVSVNGDRIDGYCVRVLQNMCVTFVRRTYSRGILTLKE